jgi:hypothetical protein
MADLAGVLLCARLSAHRHRISARARMTPSELEPFFGMLAECIPAFAASLSRRFPRTGLGYGLISVPQPPQETGHFPFQMAVGRFEIIQRWVELRQVVGGAASGLDASAVAATRHEFRRRSCRFAHARVGVAR